MKAHEAVQLIEASELFDVQWYIGRYPDVKAVDMSPAEHFYKYGWKMLRDPSSQFSTAGYLAAHKDVKKAGMNPLLHYLRFGKKEGRVVSSSQSTATSTRFSMAPQKGISKNGSSLSDSNIEKQLEKTQALLEHYFNRYKELEYQSMDKQ